MEKAWGLLREMTGTFSGEGENHERQPFTGKFSLRETMPKQLFALESTATGKSGEIYHAEHSWIGPNIMGELTLYVASNNHPGITPHTFHRIEEAEGGKHVTFRFGNPENGNEFREEITFSLFADGSVAHHYAWGLPGGKFEPRSGSRMRKA